MRRAVSSIGSDINRVAITPADSYDHHQHLLVAYFINQAITLGSLFDFVTVRVPTQLG